MASSRVISGANADACACEAHGTTVVSSTKYYDWEAWSLSDGKTQAIVVPAIGRVMSFRRVGGAEWLWSGVVEHDKVPEFLGWTNWGGDKTWLAPDNRWKEIGSEGGWPPPKEWESEFQSQLLPGGKLKIWGLVSPRTGLRISRIFYHNDKGEFVIEQTVQQVKGKPVEVAIWNITQINSTKTDAVFLPRAAKSDYDNGFRWMGGNENVVPKSVTPTLVQVPSAKGVYKIGTDSPVAVIAAVHDGWAFVERARRPSGIYVDGDAGKSGTPVQLYGNGDPKVTYLEIELLSPLLKFTPGTRWTHSVRWSLHKLPTKDVDSAKMHAAIEKLFQ